MSDRLTSRYTYRPRPRSQAARLDRRRYEEADIAFYTYVRPFGSTGLHVVRLTCNEEEIVVSGVQGRQTYAPGSVVPVGSYTNTPGKFIIGSPPPGRRGASAYSITTQATSSQAFGVISANPSTIEQGNTETVTFTCFGLVTGDDILAVSWSSATSAWVTDSYVTMGATTVASSVSATASVTVSMSAPVGYRISFRVSR